MEANKLPKKRFSGSGQNTNSLYVLETGDLGQEFIEEQHNPFEQPQTISIKKDPSPGIRKNYESDKNHGSSFEEADSFDEDTSAQKHNEEFAGYNFPGHESARSKEDELFSSDEEEQNSLKNCLCCNSVRALGNCLTGREQDLLPEDAQQQKLEKPKGLFGDKSFKQVCRETQKESPYGSNVNYGLISVIVKSPDNLTQEQFASQLIQKFTSIFAIHNLPLWLKPFSIIATCPTGGLIETIPDAVSIN